MDPGLQLDGYIQVAILPQGVTPTNSTVFTVASLVNYPNTNDWHAVINLGGKSAGSYVVYAREYSYYTNSAGQTTSTTITVS